MDSRKSMMHPRVEELAGISPTSSSPLRRRSIVAQKSAPSNLPENDDEAELRNRRLEKERPVTTSSSDRRRSFGLSFVAQMSTPQIAEKVQQCIQLNAENKINTKNAFSLQMIDFMSYMIKKRDANMNNLQVASTSLDVSTKIYGLRVDGIHTDIMKMRLVKDKQDGRKDNDDVEDRGDDAEGLESDNQVRERAKKKRSCKKKIIATAESLTGPTETINPTSTMMGGGDTQTTDMLYLATIPYHASRGTYLHLHNEFVLDTVDPNERCNDSKISCPSLNIPDNAATCLSLANFELLGWSVDDEKEEITPTETTAAENGFHFDLDASLPADNDRSNVGTNYFDMEDDDCVEACERIGQPAANIVDFCSVLSASVHPQNLEYSYWQNNMDIPWAGPFHWKFRNPSRNHGGSRIIGRCNQQPIRRKKELIIVHDEESIAIAKAKFAKSKRSHPKLQIRTIKQNWIEEKITLPEDVHYGVSQIRKYYLQIKTLGQSPRPVDANGTHVSDDLGNYDYNNEADTTDYCPNLASDDQPENSDGPTNNRSEFDENMGMFTQAFTGENLVELPKMTNEIFLPFSLRAKKIDMRQLKRCIWKNLTNSGVVDKENTNVAERSETDDRDKVHGTVKFSDIFEELPKTLSKSNVEALSLPLAVISLLHLANEKTLQIVSSDDNSDFHIRQG